MHFMAGVPGDGAEQRQNVALDYQRGDARTALPSGQGDKTEK